MAQPLRTDEFEIRACAAVDRAAQARLFNQCFKKKVDAGALAWRYDQNPHGRALSFLSIARSGEGGEADEGEPVSGYACSPRLAIARGDDASRAVIGETGDVMTHPDWRKRGLFSALDRACMEAARRLGWPLVFGLPNRRSAHIFLELGWEEVGTIRPWTFLLANDAGARRERALDGRIQSWLVPMGVRKGRHARARLVGRAAGYRTHELEAFPAEVEALSRAVEPRFAFMVRRDAAYLEWRFLRSPSKLHRALGVHGPHNAFAGYAVVQLPRAGEPTGYLVDVLAEGEGAVAAAIEAGLARLQAAGASLVRATAIDGSWWSGVLQDAGFLPPRQGNQLSVILHVNAPDHPVARAARDARAWYLTDGDRDDETMG
jgi:GNAT superfamily N-acetyltransferase